MPTLRARGLYPWEITEFTKQTLAEKRFQICLPAFLTSVEGFVQEKLVTPAVALRTAYGLNAGTDRPPKGKSVNYNQGCSRAWRRNGRKNLLFRL